MQSSASTPDDVAPGTILTCSRCSYKWALRKRGALPKNCPKCRSTLWSKNYHVCKCLKCNHEWGTANESPLRCPKCHTSKWGVPPSPRAVQAETIKSRPSDSVKAEIYRHYEEGQGCIKIALDMVLAFGEVMDALVIKYPGEVIRI